MAADQTGKVPTLTALRMRRHRARRDAGFSTYSIEIHGSTLDFLVEQGLLRHEGRDDRDQVVDALQRLLGEHIQQEQQLGHCVIDLVPRQIDQLVKFGLLDRGARTSPIRVRTAFAELVSWAFWRRQTPGSHA